MYKVGTGDVFPPYTHVRQVKSTHQSALRASREFARDCDSSFWQVPINTACDSSRPALVYSRFALHLHRISTLVSYSFGAPWNGDWETRRLRRRAGCRRPQTYDATTATCRPPGHQYSNISSRHNKSARREFDQPISSLVQRRNHEQTTIATSTKTLSYRLENILQAVRKERRGNKQMSL
ncbi:uncharacterized protein LOC133919527 [Phragmites australis]|uniref:uncharacterized protein LOC133919527 n=1 Tax=Phragmites australis TaxID=29695 RepID=UPI002D79E04D|nr:uncharacterized protein LOC133919527 [Phragmites australis]